MANVTINIYAVSTRHLVEARDNDNASFQISSLEVLIAFIFNWYFEDFGMNQKVFLAFICERWFMRLQNT